MSANASDRVGLLQGAPRYADSAILPFGLAHRHQIAQHIQCARMRFCRAVARVIWPAKEG
jgi:hypothetical protein